ncbi:RHS repeat-associated core domain-containing protein [Saccharopolyspora sp. SCSIO 74807]|uniref:RHS repeat-associated core domain-containing protein n=1 Tax=Saccharopolyspora sp. SCSIO 74807 TaxID=3118084 RepID=UPI0030CBC194
MITGAVACERLLNALCSCLLPLAGSSVRAVSAWVRVVGVAMADFPEHLFSLGGSPEAIAGSARRYDRFGESAAHAAERITSMDTGQFQGPEAEQFREKIDSELPPDLRVTGTAFSQVGTALNTFSSRLSELQGKMRPLAHQAPGLWEQLKASEGRVERAESADRAHAQAEREKAAHAPAGQAPPPGPAYESDTGDASAALSSARAAWQDCVDKANGLRTEMTAAARECTNRIHEAKGMRFKEPPASYDLIGQGQDFIRENKDVLKEISSALKVVSGALAVVGLVLQAIPVVGNAVGGAFLIAAGITGGAALAIDAGIYAATGEGSLTSILVDTALTVIPFGRVAKLGSKAIGGLSKAAKGLRGTKHAGDAAGLSKTTREMPLCKDPIDIDSGRMVMTQTDVELGGLLPLILRRTHLSSYRIGLAFGPSWASTLDQRLEVDAEGVYFASEDGLALCYPDPMPGVEVYPAEGPRWPLTRTDDGGYTITDVPLGQQLHFTQHDTHWPLTAITDRNGHRIDFHHDDTGLPTEIEHSGGYRIRIETTNRLVTALYLCDADNGADVALMRYRYHGERLTEVINASGQPLTLDYDDAGRITGWTDRNDCWYRYTYDAEGRCVRTEGSGGSLSATFDYDLDNAITHVTDSLGHTTAYHLDNDGQVTREIDPHGAETHSEWDEHRRLLARTDPLGRTTNYEYDEDGNVASVIRPDGSRIRAEYNDLRLPITLIAPDGAITRNEYDERGNLTRSVDPADAATTCEYDRNGHLVNVTDALGNTTRVEIDATGLATAITDPLGATTWYERDAFGRVVVITDPVGGATRLGWTVDGKPAWRILPDGATERWLYDGEGNLRTHVDALGQCTSTDVTHFDLPSAEVRPDGTRLEFRYDTELRLVNVTNEQGLVWRYDYDATGCLVSETDFNDRTLTYRHDAAGQLVERTNGAGETTTFNHNLLGDVVERRGGDTSATFTYDEAGRLRHAINSDAYVTFERDPAGRVLSETINGRTLTSAYDMLGRRTRRVTPSGAETDWEYDANSNPVALHTAGRTIRFDHDAAGREIHRSIGGEAVLTQAWDANHQLKSQTLIGQGGKRTQHRAYQYRADGYLTGIEDRLTGDRTFTLDRAGRVTAVQGRGWTERYAYDSAGNVTNAAWPSPEQSYDSEAHGEREYTGTLIRRAGKVRYEHDDQGRMVLRQQKRLSRKPATWQYFWDTDDRLTAVVTPDGQRWRYRYDALGRRVAKERFDPEGPEVVEQIKFSWDGTVLAEQEHTEFDPGGTVLTDAKATAWDYQPGTFRPLTQNGRTAAHDAPQQWVDENFFSIVADLSGSPSETVDGRGSIDWIDRTALWGGTVLQNSVATRVPLRFPGQYFDPETGFNYNFYRHYDSSIGRYSSADPVGLAGGPDAHRYVINPQVWIDPLGLAPKECIENAVRHTGPASPAGKLSPAQQKDLAKFVGLKPLESKPNKSHGQPVFTDGKKYYSYDVDGHSGGLFKVAKSVRALGSKQTRDGTLGLGRPRGTDEPWELYQVGD